MFNVNQSMTVLVGKDLSITAAVDLAGSFSDGHIFLTNELGETLLTAAELTKGMRFKVVQKSGNYYVSSPLLIFDDQLFATAEAYAAAAEQLSYVGYNGTSGSITATSLNDYVLGITFKHDKDMWSEQANKRIFYYTSDASATQAEIAVGLTSAMGLDTFLTDDVKVELLTDSAGTACPTAVDTITFTNGSTTISATDIDDATGTAAIAVGDFIRFAADVAGTGAEVTDVVYKIVSIDATANTAQLHMPYQGASGTIDDTDTEIIVAATAASAAFGIKLTGIAQTFTVGKFKYNKVVFDVTLKNFGSTAITNTTRASLGKGVYSQVAELEWFAKGFRKAPDRFGDSAPDYTLDAASGTAYDTLMIRGNVADSPNHAISGQKNAMHTVYVFFHDGGSTKQGAATLEILDDASVPFRSSGSDAEIAFD